MNKAFEKILEKLTDVGGCDADCAYDKGWDDAIDEAISIVQEVAEEYDNGWIAISESVPDSDRFILLSFENYPIPLVGRYVEDDEGGTFYAGNDLSLVSQNLFVNALELLFFVINCKNFQKSIDNTT